MKKHYVSINYSPRRQTTPVAGLVWVFLWFCVDARAATWESWSYQRNGDGIYIHDYAGYELSVAVPESIEGMQVTAISSGTFFWGNVTNVSLPASVTSLGEVPFDGCESLTSIQVASANSVFSSRDGVLFNKDQTTLIRYPRGREGYYEIPAGVRIIGDGAFLNCEHLTRVAIPLGVETVGIRAFFGCGILSSAALPETLASIGQMAFAYCAGLAEVTIPNTAQAIGAQAFYSCSGLTNVTIPAGLIHLGPNLFQGSGPLDQTVGLKWLTINGSVMVTGFRSEGGDPDTPRTEPTRVVIPEELGGVPVTRIGEEAFSGLYTITNIAIPAGVAYMGAAAFASASMLQAINVAEANPAYRSREGVLFDKGLTMVLQYPAGRIGGYTVPDGTTAIGARAFEGCASLSSIQLPDSVNAIGARAFANCSSLGGIRFPPSVSVIEQETFVNCGNLHHVIIPDQISEIGDRAFFRTGLKTVLVGRGVNKLGNAAFDTTQFRCAGWPCYLPDRVGGEVDAFFLGGPPETARPFREPFWGRDYSVPPRIFYWIGANGWSSTFGQFPTTAWNGEPLVTRQPQSMAVYAGRPAQLSVETVGADEVYFQWQRDGRDLPGAIGSTLDFIKVQPAAAGPYQVVVSNAFGAVTGGVATITVRTLTPGSYEAMAVALEPLAYWPLDETDYFVAQDYLAGARADLIGKVLPSQPGATPNTGTSFGFDGWSACLQAPPRPALEVGMGDFTVAAWIYPTAFAQSGIVTKGSYDSGRGWLLDFNAAGEGTLRLETSLGFPGGQGTVQTTPGVVSLNEWQHVAVSCRRDPGAGPGLDTTGNGWTRIYHNGKLVQSGDIGAGDLSSPDLPLTIGSSYGNFYGRIDEVALFGKALSGEQIVALYAAGIGGSPPLQISRTERGMTLAWTEGTLQSTTFLGTAGSQANWADVPRATSPYTVEPTNAAAFYRVRTP